MIATHNIKVNGRWVRAGESYEAEKPEKKAEKPVKEPEKKLDEKPVEEVPKAEPVKEEKPKTTTRRKASK